MTMQTTFTDEDGVQLRVETNGSNQVRLVVTDPENLEDVTMFDFTDHEEVHNFIVDLLTVNQ